MFKILAIDGGGIRGIYPARFLQWFEDKAQPPLHRFFDLIVGTSTGGIIALAVASEVKLERVVELYSTKASRVFTRRRRSLFGSDAKYDNQNLLAELKDLYGRNGQGQFKTLGDAACPVCVPAINVATGKATIFRTRRAANDDGHSEDESMWEAAACTSAAPTYFPPYKPLRQEVSYADGGLWANDPTLVGIEEALARGTRLEDIEILSIGTGSPVFETDLKRKFGGLFSWRNSLVDLAFTTQAQGVSSVALQLCGSRYTREDETLASKKNLDDLSVIPLLRHLAEQRAIARSPHLIPRFFSHPTTRWRQADHI